MILLVAKNIEKGMLKSAASPKYVAFVEARQYKLPSSLMPRLLIPIVAILFKVRLRNSKKVKNLSVENRKCLQQDSNPCLGS